MLLDGFGSWRASTKELALLFFMSPKKVHDILPPSLMWTWVWELSLPSTLLFWYALKRGFVLMLFHVLLFFSFFFFFLVSCFFVSHPFLIPDRPGGRQLPLRLSIVIHITLPTSLFVFLLERRTVGHAYVLSIIHNQVGNPYHQPFFFFFFFLATQIEMSSLYL